MAFLAGGATLLVGGLAGLGISLHGLQEPSAPTLVSAPLAATTEPDLPAPSASPSAARATAAVEAAAVEAAAVDPGLPRSEPVRLQVHAIGIDSELVDLGLAADGTLEVPASGFPAGWFTGAPTPGQTGPAVLVGHVDWDGAPGVFYRLRELQVGEEIAITRADGNVVVFAVNRVDQFAKDAFPTDEVYQDIDHAGLRLITCGGAFDQDAGHYVDNVVAYAELVRVVHP